MGNKMNVLAKLLPGGQVEYVKARPAYTDYGTDLSDNPVVGERFLFCGLTTSPVKSFERVGDGLRIETWNSVYLFWMDTEENAGIFAKGKGLADPAIHKESGSIYWGHDSRIGTYLM